MNFSGINYKSWIGKLLRFPLKLLPNNAVVPIKARAVSIDEIVKEKGLTPNILKIDVEGSEVLALKGALHTLA